MDANAPGPTDILVEAKRFPEGAWDCHEAPCPPILPSRESCFTQVSSLQETELHVLAHSSHDQCAVRQLWPEAFVHI